jgi:uncharacterized membrane protein YagU involved in acid resistance
VPSPKDQFGIISAPFQWLDIPESEALVSQSTKSTKKPVPEVPEHQRYQKHQSINPQIRFEGAKAGFSQIQTHQTARLSQAHLLVSSVFDFEHFHFSVIFLAPSKDVCKH